MTKTVIDDGRLPATERERLEALYRLDLLDTPKDEVLDRLTSFVSSLFDMPTVLVSLVDTDRQWFKASCGMAATEHPRDWSICSHMVSESLSVLVIEDTLEDSRLQGNPLVEGRDGIRFYAGASLESKDGHQLGSLCVIDYQPRKLNHEQLQHLKSLARVVEAVLHQYARSQDAQASLGSKAFYDPVTGLPTRLLLNKQFRDLAALKAGKSSIMLAVVNPLRFRLLNRSAGRKGGDLALQTIAGRLTSLDPGNLLVGRLHDDRFVVIGVSAEKPHWQERLADMLAEPFMLNGEVVEINFNIGVTVTPLTMSVTLDRLIDEARVALSQMRPDSRTQVVSMTAETQSRLDLTQRIESRLPLAIGNAELSLVYQPIVRMDDARPVAFEALVRWTLDGEAISPADFIPIAEDMGLIGSLSRWILSTACREFQQHYGSEPEVSVSVNVGAQELYDPLFVPRVREALSSSGLHPSKLRLELTEHSVIHDMDAAIRQMRELVALGVRFALDDFGTGYASLRYLQLMPVDVLKIDRCFVDGLPNDPTDVSITRATVAMAMSLGLSVVAEGIESEIQARFLRDVGVVLGQGWHFAKPAALAGGLV